MSGADRETDVVVAGTGLAGLVSALRALETGADVLVLEKGHRVGGNAPITGGTFAVDRDAEPSVDAYEPIDDGLDWLDSLGITLREPAHRWLTEDVERVAQIDPPDFVADMEARIREAGGEFLTETPFQELAVDSAGRISGAVAESDASGRFRIEAPSVVLATGGFSGNEELVERYLGRSDVWLNRHPWSTGDGFLAAQDVGGKTTRGLSNPVGHSKPAPPAQISFEDIRCDQMYETSAIAVDIDGRRFTDESRYESGSISFINDFVEKVDGDAYLLVDRRLYESHTGQLAESPTVASLVEQARDLGGTVVESDTVEGLARSLGSHGVNGDRLVETIREFNAAVRGEGDGRLDPPRRNRRTPLEEPPFYAVAVRPGIVFFRGGLDVDHNARVLSRSRSTSSLALHPSSVKDVSIEPIRGLYAAGVEVGRPDNQSYYHLGLSLGLSTGRIAGAHAAEYALERRGD